MASLISPPWLADDDDFQLKIGALASKLSGYEVADVAVVLDRWADDHPKWPAWADLRAELDKLAGSRRPPLEHRPLKRQGETEARCLATLFGQRALREGWGPAYVADVLDGTLNGFSYDEPYARARLAGLRERQSLAETLDTASPFGQALRRLSGAMDRRNAALAEGLR